MRTFSRRRMIATTASAALSMSACSGDVRSDGEGRPRSAFYGVRQSGVTSPAQSYVLLLSYDIAPGTTQSAARRAVRDVFARWTRLLGGEESEHVPVGVGSVTAGTSRLSATVAVGPRLPHRLGLRPPRLLRPLPAFAGEQLRPGISDGDVLVQLCADDQWTCVGAASSLDRAAASVLTPRWRQHGFLPPTSPGEVPRNLFGFLDGTGNPVGEELNQHVYVSKGADAHGSYLIYRRIRMDVDAFGKLTAAQQDRAIGRRRRDGVPLGGSRASDAINLFAKTPDGQYVVPADAHVRLAHPRLDGGAQMLRRGYSYAEDADDQGLLFVAFMKDPALFVRVQERLATADALSRFTRHTASAVAFVLPGARPGLPLGASLW
ncbi:Dyp-type peroxidase [Streptomyces sp. NPDC008163]|uniref:Dyp-type peroxidase n=1 Tax=Streptomyces sp. NPDC008163 TaxID=3364818 RepID=UPI0036ED81C2